MTEEERRQRCAGRPSPTRDDAEWVVVDGEGFELVDAEEIRCWCGGKDAEQCRLGGHTWPLCVIDREPLWPAGDTPRPDAEGAGVEARGADAAGTTGGPNEEAAGALAPACVDVLSAEVYGSGPFTSLAVLTQLLDRGFYPWHDPQDVPAGTGPRDGAEGPSRETERRDNAAEQSMDSVD